MPVFFVLELRGSQAMKATNNSYWKAPLHSFLLSKVHPEADHFFREKQKGHVGYSVNLWQPTTTTFHNNYTKILQLLMHSLSFV